jgi:hypothetical protein
MSSSAVSHFLLPQTPEAPSPLAIITPFHSCRLHHICKPSSSSSASLHVDLHHKTSWDANIFGVFISGGEDLIRM